MAWRSGWEMEGDWRGLKYLCHGETYHKHAWNNRDCVESMLEKIQGAHIDVLILDYTNFGHAWNRKGALKAAAKKRALQWIPTIDCRPQRRQETPPRQVGPLESEAKKMWEYFVKDDPKRAFHYQGKPVLILFGTAKYIPDMEQRIVAAPPEDKVYLEKFYRGYAAAKPTGATKKWPWGFDRWGGNDEIRYAGPSVLNHKPHVSLDEWQRRVDWCQQATVLSIFGSYDGGDNQHWGIADTTGATYPGQKYPTNDHAAFYEIVRSRLERAKEKPANLRESREIEQESEPDF